MLCYVTPHSFHIPKANWGLGDERQLKMGDKKSMPELRVQLSHSTGGETEGQKGRGLPSDVECIWTGSFQFAISILACF